MIKQAALSLSVSILFIGYCCSLQAQQLVFPDYFSVEASRSVHAIPEEDTLLRQEMQGFDISFGRSVAQRKDAWLRYLNVKHLNYSLVYLDLHQLKGDNDSIRNGLGKQWGLVISPQIHLFRIGPFVNYLLPGFGASYVNKTFFDDRQNRFIGSRLNYAIRIEYAFALELSTRLFITGGLRFYHFSNGGYKVPNAGINSLGSKIGLQYNFYGRNS